MRRIPRHRADAPGLRWRSARLPATADGLAAQTGTARGAAGEGHDNPRARALRAPPFVASSCGIGRITAIAFEQFDVGAQDAIDPRAASVQATPTTLIAQAKGVRRDGMALYKAVRRARTRIRPAHRGVNSRAPTPMKTDRCRRARWTRPRISCARRSRRSSRATRDLLPRCGAWAWCARRSRATALARAIALVRGTRGVVLLTGNGHAGTWACPAMAGCAEHQHRLLRRR